jgi:hypothetical protein
MDISDNAMLGEIFVFEPDLCITQVNTPVHILTIIQLGISPEIAPASTLGHWTLGMSSKPLPSMVKVQNMFAAKTECWELPGHLGFTFLLRLVRARYTDNLKTHYTSWKVSTTVGAAYACVDARREERVT